MNVQDFPIQGYYCTCKSSMLSAMQRIDHCKKISIMHPMLLELNRVQIILHINQYILINNKNQ